jgi:sec-independent protein translocase protein TatC
MARRRIDPEGRMSLGAHIRELRNRLLKSVLAILVASAVAFAFFDQIWHVLRRPYCQVHLKNGLSLDTVNGCSTLVFTNVFDPIVWHFKVAFIAGLILSSPIWLYQLWAFVTPGLHRTERRYALAFVGAAVPLFLAGATLAYFVMSKGLQVLLNFAPAGTTSLISIDHYLGYAMAMLLVFGGCFVIPLLIVMLNRIGVATPSGDPVTMMALGIPLAILLEVATQIARVHDARKARVAAQSPLAGLSDDEPSPLNLTPS